MPIPVLNAHKTLTTTLRNVTQQLQQPTILQPVFNYNTIEALCTLTNVLTSNPTNLDPLLRVPEIHQKQDPELTHF